MRKITNLETNQKSNINFVTWCDKLPVFACGTESGNLFLHNRQYRQNIPVMGIHQGAITEGIWSINKNGDPVIVLIGGSNESKISIVSASGQILQVLSTKGGLRELHMSSMKGGHETLSCVFNENKLFLIQLEDEVVPIELSFQSSYGKIISHEWFSDGYIALNFENGYVAVLSSHSKEMTAETFSHQFSQKNLVDLSYNSVNSLLILCKEKEILFVDTNRGFAVSRRLNKRILRKILKHHISNALQQDVHWNNLYKALQNDFTFTSAKFDSSGRYFTLSLSTGFSITFNNRSDHLFAVNGSIVAQLSVSNNVHVFDIVRYEGEKSVPDIGELDEDEEGWFDDDDEELDHIEDPTSESNLIDLKIPLSQKPLHMAVSNRWLVTAINTHIWIYDLSTKQLVTEKETVRIIMKLSISEEYLAVMFENQCLVQNISRLLEIDQTDPASQFGDSALHFPKDNIVEMNKTLQNQNINDILLDDDFFVYGMMNGKLRTIDLASEIEINEFQHNKGIKRIFKMGNMGELIFIDVGGSVYYFNVLNRQESKISEINMSQLDEDLYKYTSHLFVDKFFPCYFLINYSRQNYYPKFLLNHNYLEGLHVSAFHLEDFIKKNDDLDSIRKELNEIDFNDVLSIRLREKYTTDFISLSDYCPLALLGGKLYLVKLSNGKLVSFKTSPFQHIFDFINQREDYQMTLTAKLNGKLLSYEEIEDYFFSYYNMNEFLSALRILIFAKRMVDDLHYVGPNRHSFDNDSIFFKKTKEHINDLLHLLCCKALLFNDLQTAIHCFRYLKKPGYVRYLETLINCNDQKSFISAYVAVLFNKFSLAESLLLQSSQYQILALEFRKGLKDWSRAIELAQQFNSNLVPSLILQSALNLEMNWKFREAIDEFKEVIDAREYITEDELLQANRGLIRCKLRQYEIHSIQKEILSLKDTVLNSQCGKIFEEMDRPKEAALLYVSTMDDQLRLKALKLFVQHGIVDHAEKLFSKYPEYLEHRGLVIQHCYGLIEKKQFELAKKHAENIQSYELLTEILLDHMNQPEEAIAVISVHPDDTAVRKVIDYSLNRGDIPTAIKFLIKINRREDAKRLASEQNLLQIYADYAYPGCSTSECHELGRFFENKEKFQKAAVWYERAYDFEKALQLYLENGDYHAAIQVVSSDFNNDELIHDLIEFLNAEVEDETEQISYHLELYTALGDTQKASETVSLLAKHHLRKGMYKPARDHLLETVRALHMYDTAVPRNLYIWLEQIQLYLCVNALVKRGKTEFAALALIRLSQNLDLFSAHQAEILALTVKQAQKSGFKVEAVDFAKKLLRIPNHQQAVRAKNLKLIEKLVRKAKDAVEGSLPLPAGSCPYCRASVPCLANECPTCLNRLPICLVSGQHLRFDDFTQCPNCKFPAIHSEFVEHIHEFKNCPLCEEEVNPGSVEKIEPEFVSQLLSGFFSYSADAGFEDNLMDEIDETEETDYDEFEDDEDI
eukprot:TRINITY_DN3206_c0_g1_i1.p1 TRINITY_DN3206_c0_g1~~TRINITY_DN3206_c0_g1_i1.p1  ORF type:complete len:1571 (+),score=432.21 TRINITY_DN3206_c0_g1_i1:302-4714(+)